MTVELDQASNPNACTQVGTSPNQMIYNFFGLDYKDDNVDLPQA